MNYLALQSLSKEEFNKQRINLSDGLNFTKSDDADVRKIENLLELRPNILDGVEFFIDEAECECGRKLMFSDFIYTSLVEQWHDPSFIVHVLLGTKYFVNKPREIRCCECGSKIRKRGPAMTHYETTVYGCCGQLP